MSNQDPLEAERSRRKLLCRGTAARFSVERISDKFWPTRWVRDLKRLVWLICLVSLLAGCFPPNGAGTPAPGATDHGKCDAGLAPADVTKPADNCGVASLTLPVPLPYIPIQPIEIDLYIQSQTSCLTSYPLPELGCGIDDNRPFAGRGPDPHANPSRNRVHLILDFHGGEGRFTISPSCRIHPVTGVGFDSQKECFAPKQLNEGTTLNVTKDLSNHESWIMNISSVVVQTNYPAVLGPIEPGQVHNDWTLKIDPTSGSYTLTGTGSAFPDFAVISNNRVECALLDTHLTRLGGGPNRDYNCTGLAPLLHQTHAPAVPPSPTTSRTSGCSSTVLLNLMLAQGAGFTGVSGPPTCLGGYAMQDFKFPQGPTSNYPTYFFKSDRYGGWSVLGGGAIGDTMTVCDALPASVRSAFTRPATADSGCPPG